MRITGRAVFVLTLSALCGATLGTVAFDYFPAPIRSYLTSRVVNTITANEQPVGPKPNKNTPEPAIKSTPTPQISKAAPKLATIDKNEPPSRFQDDTKGQPKRTKFRGISIGMTRSEIEEALPREFILRDPSQPKQDHRNFPEGRLPTSRVAFILRSAGPRDPYSKAIVGFRREGSISFDSNQRTNRLELRPSFFDVQRGMRWGEFREFLGEKYDITWKGKLEGTREPFGLGGYKETRRAVGKLETGERIESTHQRIASEPQGAVESFKVQITPPLPKL